MELTDPNSWKSFYNRAIESGRRAGLRPSEIEELLADYLFDRCRTGSSPSSKGFAVFLRWRRIDRWRHDKRDKAARAKRQEMTPRSESIPQQDEDSLEALKPIVLRFFRRSFSQLTKDFPQLKPWQLGYLHKAASDKSNESLPEDVRTMIVFFLIHWLSKDDPDLAYDAFLTVMWELLFDKVGHDAENAIPGECFRPTVPLMGPDGRKMIIDLVSGSQRLKKWARKSRRNGMN